MQPIRAEHGSGATIGARAIWIVLLAARYDLEAEAMGAHGEFVTEAADLRPALERAMASGKSACVNVMIEGLPAPVV